MNVRRRALLATVAGGATVGAGCVGETCEGASLDEGEVAVEYWCDTGQQATVYATASAPDCDGTLTLEVVGDGDVALSEDADGPGALTFDTETSRTSRFEDEMLLRLRDPAGNEVARRTVSVDHYRDAPSVGLAYGQLEADSVAVGEPVTASVAVTNDGAATDYTLHFLVDSATVAEREGHVRGGPECGADREPMHEFTRSFDEPGEYRIAAAVGPGDSVTGLDHQIGTVTVGDSESE